MIPKANKSLKMLTKYLVDDREMPPGLLKVKAVHSHLLDYDHLNDPRAFCAVEEGITNAIFCTDAIEKVPENVRVGLLLHEIGHLLLDAFDHEIPGGEEVEVDAWILKNVPEAGYRYVDYPHVWRGKERTALNVQTVSDAFLKKVEKHV